MAVCNNARSLLGPIKHTPVGLYVLLVGWQKDAVAAVQSAGKTCPALQPPCDLCTCYCGIDLTENIWWNLVDGFGINSRGHSYCRSLGERSPDLMPWTIQLIWYNWQYINTKQLIAARGDGRLLPFTKYYQGSFQPTGRCNGFGVSINFGFGVRND